jgi:hypothetical protein
MTTTSRSHTAIGVAIRLGLLWQAALSVAMLRHYARHGTSFYLTNIAGAWPYVHQHALWIGAFVALCLGWRPLALILAAGGCFLALVQVISLATSGGPSDEVFTAVGVAGIGVLPAIALLMPAFRSAAQLRPDWLASAAIVALVLSFCSDGVSALPSGVLRMRTPQAGGLLSALWLGWLACLLLLARKGNRHPVARRAALASACHLFAVQLVWLAGDVVSRAGIPGLSLRAYLPLEHVLRVSLLVGFLIVLAWRSRRPRHAPAMPAVEPS